MLIAVLGLLKAQAPLEAGVGISRPQARLVEVASLKTKSEIPPLFEGKLVKRAREGDKEAIFYPQAPGDGWVLPVGVVTSTDDEWTPTIVADANGGLWVAINNLYDGWTYYYTVDIYYSGDNGLTWNFVTNVGGSGLDLGDPVLGYDPATGTLVLTFDAYNWYTFDYDVAVCRWDITGPGSVANFSYAWLDPTYLDEFVPALAVERGNSNNYTFVSFEVSDGSVWVYRVNTLNPSSYSYVWYYYAPAGYAGQVWSNASDRVIQVTFKEGSGWNSSYTAVYAYSTDRGNTWNTVRRSFPNPVYQSTSAAAFGSNYAVWTIQVNPSSSDGNIYMLWSTDNGQTWASEYWLENSLISLDSRMPMLCAERSEVNNATSEFFYFGAYREVVSGSGEGNYWFLMAPVSNADDSADWRTPPNVDQFVIPSTLLPDYNIQEANWAQLHLVAFPYNGGYVPGVVWTHAFSSTDHDIYFSRPVVPLYQDSKEAEGREALKLLTPVANGELRFQVPPELKGVALTIYRPDGSVAWRGELAEKVSLEGLAAGAYVWRVGEAGGKLLLAR